MNEMTAPIKMIRLPRIRQLTLENLGVWQRFSLEFHPRLTVIKCPIASGATTLVRALAAAAGAELPSSLIRRNQSFRLQAVWETSGVTLELPLVTQPPPFLDARCSRSSPAGGEQMLFAIRKWLCTTGRDFAAVFDVDCWACLDRVHLLDYWNLLTKVDCQVVALVPDAISKQPLPVELVGDCYHIITDADRSTIVPLPLKTLPFTT